MTVYYPLLVLVFGFVFAILLQAWFVRRGARLAAALNDAKEAQKQLTEEVTQLNEEVTGFGRGVDANEVSITSLEREIEALRKQIAEFAQTHNMQVPEGVEGADPTPPVAVPPAARADPASSTEAPTAGAPDQA